MRDREPTIRVGIMADCRELRGCFQGIFLSSSGEEMSGNFRFFVTGGRIILATVAGVRTLPEREFRCLPRGAATFSLYNVTIGVNFHWERQEVQTFQGVLTVLAAEDDTLTAVNELALEDYLGSVISSEMSAAAPLEFLKAHAVTSRSWLMAMLEKKEIIDRNDPITLPGGEIIRWYGREEHARFDVCADDHCQRYQGVTKIITDQVCQAIDLTRGLFLVHNNGICDARYHKACGGRTEDFANVWENVAVPYLTSISDGPENFPPTTSEEEAEKWINSSPSAYCNTNDCHALRQVLPSFDQETTDFFRWEVSYSREELETILLRKSGIDFGELYALVSLERGPSGRIIRLEIEGSKRTVIVGKELEIRRWLSPSHLYSSAFIVRTERDGQGKVVRFCLQGAGWGHGVGLCQIGAAMMAIKGFRMEDILGHYFRGATLRKLY
ncbi:MAG: SpoIID/LytB domain-containing protein [Syntrophales bacterium]|nr:SpoIID/LytB domain-containing protein [Syntrophales bacterium]